MQVISTAFASLPSTPAKPLLTQTVGGTDQTQVESYLRALVASELLSGIPVQTHVAIGAIPASILAEAMLNSSLSLLKQCRSELGKLLLKGHDLGFQAGQFLDQVRQRSGERRHR